MDAFNFAFTLFGLLLGFTLVEVLSGLAKASKARRRVRVGWLTPLLAVFVMLDILSFWQVAWAVREIIPISYAVLLIGLVITATYYLAASYVFPEAFADGMDLDTHYFDHRRFVLSVIWLCNAATFPTINWRLGYTMSPIEFVLVGIYWFCVACALVSRSKAVNTIPLAGLIALYIANAIL